MGHRGLTVLGLLPLAILAQSAMGSDNSRIDNILHCRSISDDRDRLACFDAATATLRTAIDKKEVMIVDRSDVQATQRSLFGITAPQVKLFDKLGSPDLQQLATVVSSLSHNGEQQLIFTVPDGAVWQQTDDYPLSGIKLGSKVTIKRAALGSFFANFEKGGSARVRRLR